MNMGKIRRLIICAIIGHKWSKKMYINPYFKPDENDKILMMQKCRRCNKRTKEN